MSYHVCDNACEISPAIFLKSRALCPGRRLLSVPICILHVLNRDANPIQLIINPEIYSETSVVIMVMLPRTTAE